MAIALLALILFLVLFTLQRVVSACLEGRMVGYFFEDFFDYNSRPLGDLNLHFFRGGCYLVSKPL